VLEEAIDTLEAKPVGQRIRNARDQAALAPAATAASGGAG
jgi:hypothetical protein